MYQPVPRTNDQLVDNLAARGIIRSDIVNKAMRMVDRGNYTGDAPNPYQDCPQGIGYAATISAPHMHAQCMELLKENFQSGAKILDVGSGSGYLTACFAAMLKANGSGKAYGMDHIDSLVSWSIKNVKKGNPELMEEGFLTLSVGDGFAGLPNEGPFDCIHVGAAAPHIPQALVDQLKIGGNLVIPVGPEFGNQNLVLVQKVPSANSSGFDIKEIILDGVRYVPLTSVEHQLRRAK